MSHDGIPITLTEAEWKQIVVPVLAQQPYQLVVVVLQKITAVLSPPLPVQNGPDARIDQVRDGAEPR